MTLVKNKQKLGFVDTTVLADALLKPGWKQDSAIAALRKFDETELPAYALKEFSAGALDHVVWMYNKLIETRSATKTLEIAQRQHPVYEKRRTATVTEIWIVLNKMWGSLAARGTLDERGIAASNESLHFDYFRLQLYSLIKRAWTKRRRLTTRVVGELPCFHDLPLRVERKLFAKPDAVCDASIPCASAIHLRSKKNQLAMVRQVIESQPTSWENRRRCQVIGYILTGKWKSKVVENKDCRAFGDAVFAVLCPPGGTIVTTNVRDIKPLADRLHKFIFDPRAGIPETEKQ
jgi:hypothetical protein